MEFKDVINVMIGHREYVEYEQKNLWEIARFQSLLIVNAGGSRKKALQVRDVPFDWDKTKVSKEDWTTIFEECDRIFEKQHKKESWESKGKKDFIKEKGNRFYG